MIRPQTTLFSSIFAATAALATVVVVILLTAASPAETFGTFIFGPFSNRYALGNFLSVASLLGLTGAGVVIAFRSGVFNLGGEGQVYSAALMTTVLFTLTPIPSVPAILIAASVPMFIAGLSGWLFHKTGADELITSFLFSAALVPVIDYLIVGPLRDQETSLLATPAVPEGARLMQLLPPSTLSTGLVWTLLAVALLWFVLHWTLLGYELRIVGYNRRLARYAGIPVGWYTTLPMALSGFLHGLAGVILVLGVHHRSIVGFSGGLGWNGIAVALIARNRPGLIVPAAIFFAYLSAGARAAVLENQTTWELGSLVQGVVFLFVTADLLKRRHRRTTASGTTETGGTA
ncbi:MAG: ABC transporter permease [Spirochaeta sp.]|jgi:ABC-type uncharacterized transport system permease subunit|nr:ABC transporter permease [Spirochaeta sp.]